jgi:type II secretory pathway component PulM
MSKALWVQTVRERWAGLQPRERMGLSTALVVLALFLVWSQLLAPAWRLWRQAPAQHLRLDAQMQRMLDLRAQAEALKNQSIKTPEQWREGLTAATSSLGGSELVWAGNTATVRLKNCTPQALARWLSDLGPMWQLQLSQASLKLNEEGLWQGQLTVIKP